MSEVVKSDWMVDPDNPGFMIRRDNFSKDYWERMSQGELVSSTSRIFENEEMRGKTEPSFPAYKPGKLNAQSFLNIFSNSSGERAESKPETRIGGRLNVSHTWEQMQMQASEEEAAAPPPIAVGKLNIQNLFHNQEDRTLVEPQDKPKARIGKLDPSQIFDPQRRRDSSDVAMPISQPLIEVGKLDAEAFLSRRLVETSDAASTESEKAGAPTFPAAKIGKLQLANLFEADAQSDMCKTAPQERRVGKLKIQESQFTENQELESRSTGVKVGKLNHDGLFKTVVDTPPIRSSKKVGKLDTTNLFKEPTEASDEASKQAVLAAPAGTQVGKLSTEALQFGSEPEIKFYKPTVRPNKMKISQLFPIVNGDSQSAAPNCQREEVVVGKISIPSFATQQGSDESSDATSDVSARIGKLDTSKLFTQEEKETDVKETRREVRKLDINKVLQAISETSNTQESGESSSPIQVGKLNTSIFKTVEGVAETGGSDDSLTPAKSTAGRRVNNRAHRISCLIDHLASDKQQELDESNLDAAEEEETVKLGRQRMSEIQSMFSGSSAANLSSTCKPCRVGGPDSDEFAELQDEGLVAANLQRFRTGAVLGSASSSSKKATTMETNYIDRKHIETVTAKFDSGGRSTEEPERIEKSTVHVGKLKNVDALFQTNEDSSRTTNSESQSRPSVGKLSASAFKLLQAADTPDNSGDVPTTPPDSDGRSLSPAAQHPCREPVRVGKLNTDQLFQANPSEAPPKQLPKVGKLSMEMFDTKESVPEPTTPVANVGKLSEARLRLNANSDTPDPDKEASVDTHIVPSGKVSSSASAFITSNNSESRSSNLVRNNTTNRKTRSCDSDQAAELQRKYEEQTMGKLQKRSPPSDKRTTEMTDMKNSFPAKQRTSCELKPVPSQQETPANTIAEAKAKFFSSMMCNSSSTQSHTSAHRLGTSILPAVETHGMNKGKALFNKCAAADRQQQDAHKLGESHVQPVPPIQGVDFEQIEDEFERLHREMIESD